LKKKLIIMDTETRAKINQLSQWAQSFPQMGGITKLIDVPMVVDTNAYASGDVIYQLIEIDGVRKKGSSGVITSISATQDVAAITIKVFAFTDIIVPAADNAAFNPSKLDLRKAIPLSDSALSVTLNTWETVGSLYCSSKNNLNAPFKVADDKEKLYLLVVAGGSITWSASDDLSLRVGILLD
jgi:hypothetical protein